MIAMQVVWPQPPPVTHNERGASKFLRPIHFILFIGIEVPPLVIEVEVVRIEHRHVHHPLEVQDPELPPVELDEFVAAQDLAILQRNA